ncbi:MAG: hypothetical protein DDT23_00240 [candidate division WS2 bacterium]|nr:hypothetical protein [Candidatus Lithacetigena glycinireducens]
MPDILIVAYHFPPDGVVGAQRVAKFSKYLKKFKWKVKVVTVKENYYSYKNPELLDSLSGVEIVRTERLPPFIPGVNEEGFYWGPLLWFVLKKEIRKQKPDIVYFTGGPFYHWILAWLLKRIYHLPYILDFRDPWSLNPYRKKQVTTFSWLARWLEKKLEPLIINEADLVVNVTEEATLMYQEKYHHLSEKKFVTLPNGVDREDLAEIGEGINFTPFDIVHTGKFGSFRNPRSFFEAYRLFIDRFSLTPTDTRFVWVGIPEESILTLLKDLNLKQYCQIVGFKPYKESLKYIQGSKICLLIAGEHPYEPTTKIFDYIFLDKYIIAQALQGGFISRVLKEYGKGDLVPFFDSRAMLKVLIRNYENIGQNISVNDAIKSRFDREHISFELSNLMLEIINRYLWKK